MNKGLKIILSLIVLAFLGVLFFMFAGAQVYTDWLWFNNLGFSQTFITMFFTNFWLRLLIGFLFAIFIYFNLYFIKKPILKFINISQGDNVEPLFGTNVNEFTSWLNKKRLNYIFIISSIIIGFLFSNIGQNLWQVVLQYLNQVPFNMTDPIFNKDVSFFVFSLPFYNFIREMASILVLLTLVIISVIYILISGINSFNDLKIKLSTGAKTHITILITSFLFLKAWDYRLSMYNLLYSPRGVVFGAGYTDINANLLGLRILAIIVLFIGFFLLLNLILKNYTLIVGGLVVWFLASLILLNIYPAFVQRFQVEPNEIARESQFISYNIDMTLKAYGLDNISSRDFQVKNDLTPESIAANRGTIDNIRLWDGRPLLSTFGQLQELRPYYSFTDVDVDRYMINGEYRQVMLSVREMEQRGLSSQAQTWINQSLIYTHGHGLVMSPVNEVSNQGLPEFFIQDIPPRSSIDITIDNPAIYYGERTNNYVIVNTQAEEFAYPMGDQNVYTHYQGIGGVQMSNYLLRILYAIRYSNMKFLLSDDINYESRIMYYRNIHERVRKVAPFLRFDRDPYPVVVDGRIIWIQDAYTTTNRFPYSQPYSNLGNYIRNSIKIVIDAYHGTMDFYVIDPNDPLALTYQNIFPDLFKDGSKMPEGIRAHLRYPQDLFEIQAELYSIYHMTDPRVFYNKEDEWNIPRENYFGSTIKMEPYYIIMQLPEEEREEFVLMLPFTPANRNNMIAWMAARSDGENYGQLILYDFPKDTLIYGPMQIESRIDQDSDISQLLSLWSQRGSRVIRGNLLVIPIEDSILYVEPVFLQAETSEMPQLVRVIVAYGDKLVMAESLEQGLDVVFGKKEIEYIPDLDELDPEAIDPIADVKPDPAKVPLTGTVRELTQKALDIYLQAQESLQIGDWASYGELQDELKNILEKIQQVNLDD